ncbi:hypothetical protein TorRG33x02_153880, partial [Trema orientale]
RRRPIVVISIGGRRSGKHHEIKNGFVHALLQTRAAARIIIIFIIVVIILIIIVIVIVIVINITRSGSSDGGCSSGTSGTTCKAFATSLGGNPPSLGGKRITSSSSS